MTLLLLGEDVAQAKGLYSIASY